MSESIGLAGVLEHIDDKADGEKLTLGDIVNSLGPRGYGPLLIALALVELLPTGAIPGVPTMLAIVIVMIAGQLVAGRSSPWIPRKLRSKGFSKEKFNKGRKKVTPFLKKIDRLLKPRLQQFTSPLAARFVGGICIICALTMPPLEIIPFASSIPSAAIGLFGVGLSAHDGLVIVLGSIVAILALVGVVYWLVV